MSKPKVSIVSITYNQELYIAQALESFVTQKADFAFEAIIADDASSDKTPQIIQEYAEKYPEIIKPILRKKNVGISKNLYDAMRQSSGDYIALCEGDDYLTDPKKLQRQADFLDNNLDFALCFHPVRVFFEGKDGEDFTYPSADTRNFSSNDLLKTNFIQTNSVMYRRQDYTTMPENILPLDWYLHLYHAQFGKIGFLDTIMAAYRRHAGGLWWDSEKNLSELLKRHGTAMMGLYLELWKLFRDDLQKVQIIFYRTSDLITKMEAIDKQEGTKLVEQALQTNQAIVLPLVEYQSAELAERERVIHAKDQTLDDTEKTVENERHRNSELSQELQQIKDSKSWKLARAIAKPTNKVRQPLHRSNRHKLRSQEKP